LLRLSRSTQHTNHIFISYRRSDSQDVTGRIYDRLISHFGKDAVFKDVDSIPFGVDFRKYLGDIVGRCSVLLVVIGDQWVQAMDNPIGNRRLDNPRDFVRIEIEAALQRGIPVVPLLVKGARMPSEDDLPSSLKELVYRNAALVRYDPDFHIDVNRLIKSLEAHL